MPKRKADLYFNGRFVGEIEDPESFVEDIRNKRRTGVLSSQLNIVYQDKMDEIRINTDAGRARRPLIVVEKGKSKLTKEIADKVVSKEIDWNYLVRNGIIEYLDSEEEENSYIALNPEYIKEDNTHVEINPVSMFGISASLIPYPEYNRGDRINYGAKMVGQSVGLPATNFLIRTDTKFNVLTYLQTPIINTDTYTVMRNYDGQNIVVAIMCWEGYNTNDAVVLNKSSIQRGLFKSFYFRTYETIKKRYWGGQEDEIKVPDMSVKGYKGEAFYKNLSEDGIINPETPVESDSVLIGKVSPLRFLSDEEFVAKIENRRETSVTVRYGERGVVDRIWISETTDGNQLVKVRVRDQRTPEIGDKFATRHGQKGVCGLLVQQEDMPFSIHGTTPDIIFNPHGIPSRMTVGQLLEIVSGKTAALNGNKINATAFSDTKEEDVRKTLLSLGFRDDGKQMLYDGRTGKAYEAMIFTGVSYYLKLDHMVANKIHARSRGPVTILTKQPTEGRAKRGGLRLGEMEQQCLVAHGAAMVIKERFDSDEVDVPICKKCGLLAVFDRIKNKTSCISCNSSDVIWVKTAYAFKLTLDELKSMGIYPKLIAAED
ncbi:MAG TPA: DNA-directed RNA polymerase subunit B [archaeon]|nr:DNA-directed RNA polymerase subunit B [archaeon]